jgi:hypothetical protein
MVARDACSIETAPRQRDGSGFDRARHRPDGRRRPTPERSEQTILYKNPGRPKLKHVSNEMNLTQTGWSADAPLVDLNQDRLGDLPVLKGDDHYYYENSELWTIYGTRL